MTEETNNEVTIHIGNDTAKFLAKMLLQYVEIGEEMENSQHSDQILRYKITQTTRTHITKLKVIEHYGTRREPEEIANISL